LPNGNTSSQITTMLNASFKPKKVSVNMLRHAFLTHYYNGKMPSLEDMTETAKEMGHSVEQALKYIKN
jgi:integrase